MNGLNIVLIILSSLIVFMVVIFDGDLKKKEKQRLNWRSFKSEVWLVTPFGWIVLVFMLALNTGQGIVSHIEKQNQEELFTQDTLRFTNLISHLEQQHTDDSLSIIELKTEVKNNGLKSDSIRKQVVDNAIQELNQIRKEREDKIQNSFLQMVSEVEDNLTTILLLFQKDQVNGYIDTTVFIGNKISSKRILNYVNTSNSSTIVGHFIETIESIDKVNEYQNLINRTNPSEARSMYIRQFNNRVETSKHLLISIYSRLLNIEHYKEYESIDFSNPPEKINEDALKVIFSIGYLINKTDAHLIKGNK